WMFQYYLRAQGLALSWIGTGRLIFSLNYTDADFEQVVERVVAAATEMEQDGWWWQGPHLTSGFIKRSLAGEFLQALLRTSPRGISG
ncbi:MAG: glutamate-1-semialdehyde 2,1-aminomutase, partial [Proteobacteria bacterium]|nr:glutamate-1-semialdehyde 2,1-aminomutase [Pseudomonadota bacterium]